MFAIALTPSRKRFGYVMALQRKLADIGDGKMPDGMIPKRFLFEIIGQ